MAEYLDYAPKPEHKGDVLTRSTTAAPKRRSPATVSAKVVPVLGIAVLIAAWGRDLPAVVEIAVVAMLAASVPAVVHHAEVVAHRVGEPFGSLILAVAVTVIEVGLIITLMVSGGAKTESLARDTVFACDDHL